MKILVAPDSFKDALSALEVCKAIQKGAQTALPGAEIVMFPLSDGGEGLAEVLAYHLSGEMISVTVDDPLGRPVNSAYFFSLPKKTALVEMAQASGLQLLKNHERNPLKTSTYGTGQLIMHAIENGAKTILLGIGGSATNDAGMGMAKALGFHFLDENGKELEPVGENLSKVAQISGSLSQKKSVQFEVLSDVSNPLFGSNGAAHVFAQQKGADEQGIQILDEGLRHFADLLEKQMGKSIAQVPGAGAAGGVGAGAMAFLGATLKPGIEAVMDLTGFDDQLEDVDLIITGEGKLDGQTAHGKLIHGICQQAKARKIPVVAFCGALAASTAELEKLGIEAAFSISRAPQSLESAIVATRSGLESLAYNVLKITTLGKT